MPTPPTRPAAAPRRALAARAILGAILVLVGLEAGLWLQHGGAQPSLPIYAEGGAAGLRLAPGSEAAGLIRGRGRFAVQIAADGSRAPRPDSPAGLVLGDSLAFGLGVPGEAAASAVASPPFINGGVPGFGAIDALLHARDFDLPAAAPRLLILNPVDDGAAGGGRLVAAARPAGGFLLPRGAPPAAGALLRGPLGHSRLLLALMGLGGALARARHGVEDPLWSDNPIEAERAFGALGAAVAAELAAAPGAPWAVLWGSHPLEALGPLDPGGAAEPIGARLDAAGRRRAAEGLRAAKAGLARGLGPVPLIDLAPALAGCAACYLSGDLHWSAEGHARVALALAGAAVPPQPEALR